MEESEDNMSSEDVKKVDSSSAVKKPKKRSMVERELETNMTARVTSPAIVGEGLSTSRYGRARRLKTEAELIETQKILLASIKSPDNANTPGKVESPVYRMHACNSPHKSETPKKSPVTYLDNQIDNIYQENISLSRFSDESVPSPAKKFPKVYIRKDLIQNREEEETVMLIKNLFSPAKSNSKSRDTPSDSSINLTEKYTANQNGHVDNSSVVKTLDFDGNKKKKDDKEQNVGLSKNELFDLEAKCPYQVGDLAWARVGSFPFWPCIITRDPYSEMFLKKKLFGRVEHDIFHVTFFGDNGRRSWIVDNMLRKYTGLLEFESTRDKFTPEDKKKDPKLYAAFFVSEKKQPLWNMSVEEAETLLREPKRLRIDIFNEMLWNIRASKKPPKSGNISRTNSDVSLSESLYDSLFSENEVKSDDLEHSKKAKSKSFDVSEVVTACLDNMAAKTGITKIQRQSHMDRWLQKAKSKTPEKTQSKPAVLQLEKPEKAPIKTSPPLKLKRKCSSKTNMEKSEKAQIKTSPPLKLIRKSSSKTNAEKPEKAQIKPPPPVKLIRKSSSETNTEKPEKAQIKTPGPVKLIRKSSSETNMENPEKARIKTSPVKLIRKSSSEFNTEKPEKAQIKTSSPVKLIRKCSSEFNTEKPEKAQIKTSPVKLIRKSSFETNIEKTEKAQIKTSPVKLIRKFSSDTNTEKPENAQIKTSPPVKLLRKSSSDTNMEKPEKAQIKTSPPVTLVNKSSSETKSPVLSPSVSHAKPYRFRSETESDAKLTQIEDKSIKGKKSSKTIDHNKSITKPDDNIPGNNSDLNVTANVGKRKKTRQNISTLITIDDHDKVTLQSRYGPKLQNSVNCGTMDTAEVDKVKSVIDKVTYADIPAAAIISVDDDANDLKDQADVEINTNEANYTLSNGKKTKLSVSLRNETIDKSSVDNTVVTSNKLDADASQSIQDKQLSEIDAEGEKKTSVSIGISNRNSDNNKTHHVDLSKRSLNISIEANSKTSVSNASQDSLMEIDETKGSNGVETFQNKSEPANTSNMEVDESSNFEGHANEDTSPDSKTVSNKSVEDNVVTDLKEAQHVVTIEVSVTEKNIDDTLNKLLQDGEQGSIEKLNPSQIPETKFETVNFLDKSNSLDKDMSETKDLVSLQNSSTPEKYKRHKTAAQNSRIISRKKLNAESKVTFSNSDNFFRNEQKVTEIKDDMNESSTKNVHNIENSVFGDHIVNDDKDTIYCRNDILNESANSESILELFTDDPEIEKGETVLETSIKYSIISESISEISTANESENGDICTRKAVGMADKVGSDSECVAEEIQNDSTRQYVESPTFTQLLESEEFFRDVNETYNSSTKLESYNSKPSPELHEITANKVENSIKNVELIEGVDEDDNTSEDEPSPEYESLDDEITEDFRKHMMSIESNIKDKKDEEQIVKICNEIAEKAKLSPTKYTEVEETTRPINKLDINSKTVSVQSRKENNIKTDKHVLKVDKHCIALVNRLDIDKHKLKASHADSSKVLSRSQKQTRIDIQSDVGGDKYEDTKMKINGNATLREISDKSKIIYRTRSSVSSVTKESTSSDIKIESSKIDQCRKSCEYIPKVVIIRLDRDKMDYAIGTSKSKPLDENKSENNKSITLSVSSDKHTENKTIEHADDNSKNRKSNEYGEDRITNKKSRLSLRQDSPKRKHIEYKIQNLSENKVNKSLNATSKFEEEMYERTKVPRKIEIKNDGYETGIPEPVLVNGYHHPIDITDTPDLSGDTDFDVDAVSLNSEDSEVSLPNSFDSIPKRSLRSRPERTLDCALKNPEFLKYLELRQDYLMDLHPELNEDEVVGYVHKTWQYEEDLKSEPKKTDDPRNSLKSETPHNKKSKKSQPKNSIENFFREKYEKSRNTIDFDSETSTIGNSIETIEQKPVLTVEQKTVEENMDQIPVKRKRRSKSSVYIDFSPDNSSDLFIVKDKCEILETISVKSEESVTPKRSSRSRVTSKGLDKEIYDENKPAFLDTLIKERDVDTASIDSEDSEIPLRELRSRVLNENHINGLKKETNLEVKADVVSESKEPTHINKIKDEADETASTVSDNEPLVKQRKKKTDKKSLEDPGFLQYLELRQDAIMDENPQLTHAQIVQYLHNIWVYEENSKSALDKNDELEQEINVQLNNNEVVAPAKKVRGRPKIEKQTDDAKDDVKFVPKEKPRRRIAKAFYNENYSDIEDELEVFEIFKTKKSAITVVSKAETEKDKSPGKSSKEESSRRASQTKTEGNEPELLSDDVEYVDETEIYFTQLTTPKPNVFKGLIREKVCDICECAGSLVKCKSCYGMFHPDCVKRQAGPTESVKESDILLKGRKKKRKTIRKLKSLEDSESHSDERSHDVSADTSIEDAATETCTVDADLFESQLELKMKEILDTADINYDSYSSDDGVDWQDTVAGKCEIVDVKWKRREPPIDHSNFKCNDCRKHDVPICFVCKSAISKTGIKMRQRCQYPHCHTYYHLECLEQWPQTQFNSSESSRLKPGSFSEWLWCPRHVCHSCVSDDPRGCRTRFSGDKLARCARCPATYHSFNRCVPAGSRLLSGSHIICPRHSEQKAGRVPCHVNTGWCFICALGGSLICCEYCPTSFHAECLNIQPPDGNYMCEDCETGRLPLYGEMVWVKLGQYRWWPGIILHPSEIPENILQVKHELGDFVVRFFGQYDHYWVNRGRVFPYQEGDSGRISSQKSKINEDFILAIEHAQRAFTILKNAPANEEESLDIASSLLPPHYVKLRTNKPSGSLCGRKTEDPSLSLTQCECSPEEPDPCGPYSQCLNRMLLTECGPACRAGERCLNRAFERRTYPKLAPHRAANRGWGLRTLEDIKAGQFVIEYVGELIDEAEFRRRMRRKHEVRDENFYFLTLDKERMIDAGPKGNVARFMNHCCEPNCETQKWTVLGDVRVGLFALRDIPANSEVTFNYNLECAGIEKKRCLCGAKRCSGYIGAKPKQDASQSKKGKDGKPKRTYKKKKPEESPSTSKTKKKLGRPPKPKELTDLEKDVLIIKNATNSSSDESKAEDKNQTITKKSSSISSQQVPLSNGQETTNTLKRKRVSISSEEVSICNEQEPCVKKLKCDKPSEVGD